VNFHLVLKYLLGLFREHKIPYALIGGLALGMHGIIRATQDIDFIIPLEDIRKVEDFLLGHGYQKLYRSDEVASYVSDNFELGRIDFILAHRKYAKAMINNAVTINMEDGREKVNVASLEDLIGLKLQAYYNRKDRKTDDIKDIENIIGQSKSKLDYDKVREYFSIFNAMDMLNKMWKGKDDAQ